MPIYTIKTPTGRELDIEANDPDTALRGAREFESSNVGPHGMAPLTMPEPGQPASIHQPAMPFRSRVGWQGAGRGLTEIPSYPLDVAATGARIASEGIDQVSTFFGGPELDLYEPKMMPSEAIAGLGGMAYDAVAPEGYETVNPDQMSETERYAYETNRFAAQGAGGATALTRAAANPMSSVPKWFSRPYKDAGLSTVVGDAAAGAGSGAALSGYEENMSPWVQEKAPALDPVARVFTMLFGGVGGAGGKGLVEGAGNMSIRGGKRILGKDKVELGGERYSAADVDDVAGLVQGRASNPAVAAKDIESNISDPDTGVGPYTDVLPTTGLMTDDVGLIGAENAARQRNPVPFIERDQQVNTNARELLDSVQPPGSLGRDFSDMDKNTPVRNMRNERSTDYNRDMEPLLEDDTVLDFQRVDDAAAEAAGVGKFKDFTKNPKPTAVHEEITETLDEFRELDPEEYHTIGGFDALKQRLGKIRDKTQEGTPERKVADDVYHAVVAEIGEQNPAYGDIMRRYGFASRKIERTEEAFGKLDGKDPANAARAIFSSGDPHRTVQTIKSAIGNNQEQLDGLKASVIEYLVENKTMHAPEKTTTGANPVSFAQLDDLILKHEKTLATIFSPEEMQKLHALHRLTARFKNRDLKATTGSATAERLKGSEFLDTLELLVKAPPSLGGWGNLAGGGIMRSIRLAMRRSGIDPTKDREAITKLSEKFFMDPKVAQHLLSRKLNVSQPKWVARLNVLLGLSEAGRQIVPANEEENGLPSKEG